MIRAGTLDTRTPQQALADAIGGAILGPSTIQVGNRLIVAHPSGIVRVDGIPLGCWDDGTDALAAEFGRVTS